ncbi:MAG TPA: LptE family protein [Candidatus Paceibacterota bacterium]|nr:LptE family protein [Verrucomicrobiota bacterium]HSA10543.1 LptE family protein [Candidatus Paceibacterota bacterium]
MRVWCCLFAGVLALSGSGCAGYKLGPVNGLAVGEKSVQVNPFLNETIQPNLGDAVTAQLRKQLQRDGTYKLATHNDGDIVLSGSITRYGRQEVSFSAEDVLTVRDYRLDLTAQVTAHHRSTGKVILDQPVKGTTLMRVTSDMTSAERQALPLLATDLARNVTTLLAEGGW